MEAARVTVPDGVPLTAHGVIAAVVAQLPPGWQATKLPGLVMLYKEQKVYPFGSVIARS